MIDIDKLLDELEQSSRFADLIREVLAVEGGVYDRLGALESQVESLLGQGPEDYAAPDRRLIAAVAEHDRTLAGCLNRLLELEESTECIATLETALHDLADRVNTLWARQCSSPSGVNFGEAPTPEPVKSVGMEDIDTLRSVVEDCEQHETDYHAEFENALRDTLKRVIARLEGPDPEPTPTGEKPARGACGCVEAVEGELTGCTAGYGAQPELLAAYRHGIGTAVNILSDRRRRLGAEPGACGLPAPPESE